MATQKQVLVAGVGMCYPTCGSGWPVELLSLWLGNSLLLPFYCRCLTAVQPQRQRLRCRNCVVLERDKYEALRGRRWFAEQQTSAVVFERRPFGMSRIAGETAYIVGQV
eukprot:1405108-Pleurochrysis_carterae.AAC.1